jgi:mannose-6-phosphate isomerase-like protein (cupin superfamily)
VSLKNWYKMKIHKIADSKGEFFRILETTERSQIGVMTIQPGSDSGPEEIHRADQIIYAIEGEADVEVKKEKERIRAGELVVIPAGARHHIWNKNSAPFFFITVYAPPEY